MRCGKFESHRVYRRNTAQRWTFTASGAKARENREFTIEDIEAKWLQDRSCRWTKLTRDMIEEMAACKEYRNLKPGRTERTQCLEPSTTGIKHDDVKVFEIYALSNRARHVRGVDIVANRLKRGDQYRTNCWIVVGNQHASRRRSTVHFMGTGVVRVGHGRRVRERNAAAKLK